MDKTGVVAVWSTKADFPVPGYPTNKTKKPRQADNLREYEIKQVPRVDILYS